MTTDIPSDELWQAWTDDSGLIVRITADAITAELVCEATQRRYLRFCLLKDYFTEQGRDGFDPIRDYVARDMDQATAAAIAEAVRSRC